ncbi:TPA: hypothetical protein J1222_000999 [Escherichia coli]|uniref:Glyoxalase-related protein domain-containing protein n=2 Tax=Escherichia coli TaxID=562 RepID=A0A4D0XRB8_ECOLX|nr:glyoxalase superfamily protein [Escherichia coli]HDQ6580426.1 hypothetical protein [Escherichia coli O146:H21]EED1095391.1 hypothetical protein [Escherichia coli]EEU9340948.1 hypothetical protein [Escherichia coli]EEV7101768.1 hypothetical protein [Escherichia coli]EEX2400138.1 hypothetical protein [Escherichia coli]
MNLKSVSLGDVKTLAKRLCSHTRDVTFPLTHSSALNVVSAMLGYRNYNTLRAQYSESQKSKEPVKKHNDCSDMESFLSRVFDLNKICGANMQSIYLPAFCAAQFSSTETSVVNALKSLGRHFILVDAWGKSERDIYSAIIGKSVKTISLGWRATREQLLLNDTIVVLSGISQSTINKKVGFVRGLIKTLDDAHFENIIPAGNLIFIDSPSFLEKNWDVIGAYFAVSGPAYYMT